MRIKVDAISHLDSAHKSGDAWVRIASSVQAWVVVHWEDPQRLEPIRIPTRLIPINEPPAEDCTLEAMRTQACANQCMVFKVLLFALPSYIWVEKGKGIPSSKSGHATLVNRHRYRARKQAAYR